MNRGRIALFTFVHPDLLPPVHQMAKSYQDEGFVVDVLSFGYSKSSNSFRTEGLVDYAVLDIYSGSFIRKLKLHVSYRKGVRQLSFDKKYEILYHIS